MAREKGAEAKSLFWKRVRPRMETWARSSIIVQVGRHPSRSRINTTAFTPPFHHSTSASLPPTTHNPQPTTRLRIALRSDPSIMVICTRKGCGKEFDPTKPDDAGECRYHPGGPVRRYLCSHSMAVGRSLTFFDPNSSSCICCVCVPICPLTGIPRRSQIVVVLQGKEQAGPRIRSVPCSPGETAVCSGHGSGPVRVGWLNDALLTANSSLLGYRAAKQRLNTRT